MHDLNILYKQCRKTSQAWLDNNMINLNFSQRLNLGWIDNITPIFL